MRLFTLALLLALLIGCSFSSWVTNGTITYDGAYNVVTFTSNGTFNTTVALNTTVLVVAGGGGGAGFAGGGGGGGGLIYNTSYNAIGNITVVVGLGGAAGIGVQPGSIAGNGTNSTFGTLNAAGGGGGGSIQTGGPWTGGNGGSGGGGGGYGSGTTTGGTATPAGQGNDGGGNAGRLASPYPAGGGGGAGAKGQNATGASVAGNGGIGLNYSINGTNTNYSCGGGGSTYAAGTAGVGGCASAGNGSSVGVGKPAINGTGSGGGGGGGDSYVGSTGGSGIVIIRFLNATTNNPVNATISSFTNSSTSHQFNVSAYADDADGGTDITKWNWTIDSGSCANASNTTSGNRRSINLTCTGTSPTLANITIRFTDNSGLFNTTSTSSNTYPDHAASLTTPTITGTAAVGNNLTCANGTWSDVDSDLENVSSRTWVWYNGTTAIGGATSNQWNITYPYVGASITCSENTTNTTWPASNATANSSATIIPPLLALCANLSVANTTYNLTKNISTTGTCFNITAANITLDCAGYSITGNNSTSTYGVYSNQLNTTVKNCKISNFSNAIDFENMTNSSIQNSTLNSTFSNGHGLDMINVNNTIVANIISSTTGSNLSYDIFLTSCFNNTITNATTNTTGTNAYGIYYTNGQHNNMTNLVSTTSGTNAFAIYLLNSSFDYLQNVTFNSTGLNSTGFYIKNSNNDTINGGVGSISAGDNAYGIYFNSGFNNTITNLALNSSGVSAYGIFMANGNTNFERNISVLSSGTSAYGVYLQNSTDGDLSNSNTSSSGSNAYGIYLDSTKLYTISNISDITTGDSAYALYMSNSSSNILFNVTSTTDFTDSTAAIYMLDSNNNNMTRMTTTANGSNVIAQFMQNSNNNTIANGTIYSDSSNPIGLFGSSNNTFFNNTLTVGDLYQTLLYINAQSGNNTVYQNNFTATAGGWVNDLNGTNNFNYSNMGNIYYYVNHAAIWTAGNGSNLKTASPPNWSSTGYGVNITNFPGYWFGSGTDYWAWTNNWNGVMTSCRNLNITNYIYNMTQSVSTGANTNCFNITAANVTLDCKGYTITGAGGGQGSAVYSTAFNSTIKNCIATSFVETFVLDGATNSTVLNNTATASTSYGFRANGVSTNNIFINNTATGGSDCFILNFAASYNTLIGNSATSCGSGFDISGASHTTLINNTATYGASVGTFFIGSSYNVLINNTAIYSSTGFNIQSYGFNNFTNNRIISPTTAGFLLYYSANNIFTNNTITQTAGTAIYIDGVGSNNTFFLNNITAPAWVYDATGTNFYNSTLPNGSNVGNIYYFANGTGSWDISNGGFNISCSNNASSCWADQGTSRPFNATTVGGNWSGFGNDSYPYTNPQTILITSIGISPNPLTTFQSNASCWIIANSSLAFQTASLDWFKNGINMSLSATLNGVANNTNTTIGTLLYGNFSPSDNISCAVKLVNGSLSSGWNYSANITVPNSAPSISSLALNPNPPLNYSNISCVIRAQDHESATLTAFYWWFKNGVNLTTTSGSMSISNNTSTVISNLTIGNFTLGDNITCQAIVSDGVLSSALSITPNGTVILLAHSNNTATQSLAQANQTINWTQQLFVSTGIGTCTLNLTQIGLLNNTTIQDNFGLNITHANYQNLSFLCNATSSPYNITFQTNSINQTMTSNISYAGLGGAVQVRLALMTPATSAILYNLSYNPGTSYNQKLWLCTGTTNASCDGSATWTPQSFYIINSAFSKNITITQNETVYVWTYDTSSSGSEGGGGGGGGGGVIYVNPNQTITTPQQLPGTEQANDIIARIDAALRQKTNSIPNALIAGIGLMGFAIIDSERKKNSILGLVAFFMAAVIIYTYWGTILI